jgi:phosphoesterase RecJ-like protein
MKTEKNNSAVKEIRLAFEHAGSIGIVTHVRPDGDAIGSLLGLGLALRTKGKAVQMVLPTGISRTFRHLPGANLIQRNFESPCELYVSLDCADLKRSRGLPEGAALDINIDHHITNERFARINYILPDAVATCAILADLLPQLGLAVDQEVASALLSGILSDSIGFRTSNTNTRALEISAKLMHSGADLYALYNKALVTRPYSAAKYWGYALARMQRKDGVVWTSLTLEDRHNSGYKLDDDADLTNVLSSIEEARISLLLVEQSTNKSKVSWRAVPGVDVSALASEFNGGGHPGAAGAEMTGSLSEIEKTVVERTLSYLHSLENKKQGEIKGQGTE